MDFDVVVIGSGPGGYVAAIRASQLGKKTAIIERAELGGICLNWGCIPTKALLRSAEVYHLIQHSQDYGFGVKDVNIEFDKIIKRSREVAGRLSKGVAFLMRKNKIEVINGFGTFKDKNTIEVQLNDGGTRKVTATNIILATGTRARQIPGMEVDGERVLSYREAMVLKELPKSMIVVGAGAIGVEFAYFYKTLGVDITLVEMMPHILPIEDEEISKELEKSFKKSGMKR